VCHSVASDTGVQVPGVVRVVVLLSTAPAPTEAAAAVEPATAVETTTSGPATSIRETTISALEIPVSEAVCHIARSASQRGIARSHAIRATDAALP
jgi:hypothetical protein